MHSLPSVDWSLCLVADVESAGDRDLLKIIKEAVSGGVTLVQLRAKTLSARETLNLGRKAAYLLRAKKIPLIINDRVDIALACGAQGVHLGQDDIPLAAARKLLGRSKLIGLSAANIEEAAKAEKDGADYLGLGPVFPTRSKDTKHPPLGVKGVKKICARLEIPVLAIGGLNRENAGEVVRAGASGVAVISALMGAKDIRLAARLLRSAISSR